MADMVESACPSPERLVAFAGGSLPGSEREPLLAHLEACPECRDDVAEAVRALRGRAREAGGARRWALPLAAAAALALVASLVSTRPPAEGPGKETDPAAVDVFPFPALPASGLVQAEAGDLELPLGRSGLLVLREGAKVALAPEGPALLAGDLGVETHGEPVRLRLGEAVLVAEDAALVASMSPGAAAAWSLLSDAHAAEAAERPGRVVLLRGSARLRQGERECLLQAGQESDLGTLEARPAGEPAWRPDQAWRPLPGLPRRLQDEAQPLGGPGAGQGYAWEVLVRREESLSLFAVVWASGGKAWRVPLGQGALGEAGPWVRVRLEASRGWVRLWVGGRELMRCREERLAEHAYAADPLQAYPGLSVWGGKLEVAQGRWKPLP